MEAGLAQHDSNATARAAHSLKGSASNLGATRLAAECARMEQNAKSSEWTGANTQLEGIKVQLQRVRDSLKAEIQVV
jgi:HPt (histidine-containing phosphotransfer) domain-containing protein